MSGIGLGLGLAHGGIALNILPPVTGPVVALLPDGALEIVAGDGTLDVTVTAPADLAGSYQVETAALADGPVNLVAPEVTGDPASGATMGLRPGLWLFDATRGTPQKTYRWIADGAVLAGATGSTLTVGTDIDTLAVEETLTQAGGNPRAAVSAAVTVLRKTQTVTIPAGTVSADLPGFPVRIDLADLTPDLWDALRPDGGNLRATNADAGVEYPLDTVWIDPETRTGTAFVRCDLTAGTDTAITLRTIARSQGAVSPDATTGRAAVWADHLAVLAFPDTTDRTGRHATELRGIPQAGYAATQVSGGIAMHQGCAWDGTHWYVTDTNQIRKFDADWNPVLTASDPVGDSGLPVVNHLGDPCIHADELLVPLEYYNNGSFSDPHVAVYNPVTLAFIRAHPLPATREISGFAVNPADGFLYVTDFTDGGSIPYYGLDGTPEGTLVLSQTLPKLQGITFHKGAIYVTDDQNDRLWEIDLAGNVTPAPIYTSAFGGSFEGIESDGSDLYVLIDATPSAVYRIRDAGTGDTLEFDGLSTARIAGVPVPAAWTASVTVTPTSAPNNGGAISLVREGSVSNRASAVVRQSSDPDSYNAWDNANGYIKGSGARTLTLDQPVRYALAYDGMRERKLLLDGAAYAVDAGVTARPGGGTMSVVIGAKDHVATGSSANREGLYGSAAFAFVYDGYMSDARIAAEYATLHTPGDFYVVS